MKRLTFSEFASRVEQLYGNRYDCSKAKYSNWDSEVEIVCPDHGSFFRTPRELLPRKQGCPTCIDNARRAKLLVEFICRASKLYDGLYDYKAFEYDSYYTPGKIVCPEHGLFWQSPERHLLHGTGCKSCAKRKKIASLRKSLADFIAESILEHGNKFDYSKVIYLDTRTKIEIVCPVHGSFWQSPAKHLSGHGCSRCTKKISESETLWLDALNVPREWRQKKIKLGKRIYTVDAFDEASNTVYEFYGDFWHGNPKIFPLQDVNNKCGILFGDLFKRTIMREALLVEAGYKVAYIWERDFREGKIEPNYV